MNTNIKDEVKLMNLVRFIEIYKGNKWAIKDLLSDTDTNFIKSKVLETINGDLLSETLRNNCRIKVLNVNNNENIIRFSPKELDILRLEILKNIFRVDLEETEDAMIKEVASGNIIDVLAIQSKNGFFKLSEEQTKYLNEQLEKYKNTIDTSKIK